ncbi:MAG: PAS domain-containing protein, partial [Woeseiaceae bacterium]
MPGTLRTDPVIWAGAAALIVLVLLYSLPVFPGLRATVAESYGEALMAAMAILAAQYGLQQVRHREERRFWHLVTAAFVAMLAVKIAYAVSTQADTINFSLATDVLYLLFYAFIILAANSAPHLQRGWSHQNIPYWVESLGGIVFVIGLLIYFVLIPSSYNEPSYQTNVPSLFLFLTLDVFLIAGFLYLRWDSGSARWRSIYGAFALAAVLWTSLDFIECLMYMEVIPYAPLGTPLDAPWLLPFATVIVAARMRHHAFAADALSSEQEERQSEPVLGFRGPLLIYASALPLIHFGLYSTGLLDIASRSAREVCLFVFLALLGGIAVAHHKFLEEDRERADERLRQSEERYRTLFEENEALVNSIDGIVWSADARTFQFTFVSKQAERILGYSLEEWLLEPDFWPKHIHPEDRDQAVAYCLEATAKMEDHDFEYRMIAADGREVWIRDIVSVVVEDD